LKAYGLMVDWFEIPAIEQHRWGKLAKYALQRLCED
jgi:hypothetical protein